MQEIDGESGRLIIAAIVLLAAAIACIIFGTKDD